MASLHPQATNRAADMARADDADTQLVAAGRLRGRRIGFRKAAKTSVPPRLSNTRREM
jgi:hypothetical protein